MPASGFPNAYKGDPSPGGEFVFICRKELRWQVRKGWEGLPDAVRKALETSSEDLEAQSNAAWRIAGDLPEGAWTGGEARRGVQRKNLIFPVPERGKERWVFLKIFFERGWERLLGYFHLSRGWREWRGGGLLLNRGIPSPDLLGFGRGKWGKEGCVCIVAEEGFPHAIPLHRFLKGKGWIREGPISGERREVLRGGKEKAAFICTFSALMRKIHDAGIRQRDLHPANLLLEGDAHLLEQDAHQENLLSDRKGGPPRLFMVDFHSVRGSGPLTWKARMENLAVLNLYFFRRSSRHDRFRFLREYLFGGQKEEARRGFDFLLNAAREVENLTRRKALKLWRKREARCLRENPDFRKLKTRALRGMAVNRPVPGEVLKLIEKGEEIAGSPGVERIKDSRTASSFLVQGNGEDFFLKIFHWKKLWNPLLDIFRGGRARRAWRRAYSLALRGIPTAPPVVFLEKTFLFMPLKGYLLFRRLKGFTSLSHFPERAGLSKESLSERREGLRAAARLVKILHDEGFRQRDIKASNIMIRTGERRGEASVVDLDGLRFQVDVPRDVRMKDLFRLYRSLQNKGICKTDSLRFLKTYLGSGYGQEKRRYWRGIAGYANRL